MATFLARITVRPGAEEAFERTISSLYAATHEHEPRVRRYEYWRGREPRTYYTLASFEDFHAFLDHQTSDHHEGADLDLAATIESTTFEWVDPVADASPLPATDMQDLPRGASETATKYHQRFEVPTNEWWAALRQGGRARRG